MTSEQQTAITRIIETVGPSTVRIGRAPGRGTGFVIGDGLILTNAHNLRDRTTTVFFADGTEVQGTAQGVDGPGDLAVLAVERPGVAAPAWADAAPAIGTPVLAVALTHDGSVRVTAGAVSSVGRSFRGPGGRLITGAFEHDATLGRGSSGGPLVDLAGRLVGVNTHRLGDGLTLAQTADADLRARVDALAAGHSPTDRRLGVALVPSPAARRLRAAVGLPERDGLLIRDVADDSPAAAAGLRGGDLIVSAGGRPTPDLDQLRMALAAATDDTLAVTVVRGSDEVEVSVHFPSPDAAGS